MRSRAPLLWLLLLALAIPSAVTATGTLTIPNVIAIQPGPQLQASLLDTNWSTIASYVNAREITQGLLAARPVAGTAGRYYFATDDNGGTLYADNGAAWVQISPAIFAGQSAYAVRGLRGATSVATNTTYNVTADWVQLRNPSSGSIVVRRATTSLSNNVLTTGPVANARDQVAVFTPSSWVHLYYIWNGTTLATVSSPCAPTDVTGSCPSAGGPNLPPTYTHWAYIGPVRFATTGTLNVTFIRGARAVVPSSIVRASAAGTGAEQSWNVADRIPPNHLGADLVLHASLCSVQADILYDTGSSVVLSTTQSGATACAIMGAVPINAQTIFFNGNAGAAQDISIIGYRVPNGGE